VVNREKQCWNSTESMCFTTLGGMTPATVERRGLTLEIAAAAEQDLDELRPEPVAGAGFGGGGHFSPTKHCARGSDGDFRAAELELELRLVCLERAFLLL
jgi:hypothetical protein